MTTSPTPPTAWEHSFTSVPFPDRPWDNIVSTLYLGGHDTAPGGADAHVTDQFDMVVSLFARDGYGPNPGIPHYTHTMLDGPLQPVDHPEVERLASLVNQALDAHHSVLVRCHAGLNRSALVTGLALIQRGWTATDAIDQMRAVRSPWVLCNASFEAYLYSQEERLRGGRTRCPACQGHQQWFGAACEECAGLGSLA